MSHDHKHLLQRSAWRHSIYVRAYIGQREDAPRLLLVILFGLVPWCLFWVWFSSVVHILEGQAISATILASLWMLVAPVLMATSEVRLYKLLKCLSRAPQRHGWRLTGAIRSLQRINRWYWPICGVSALIFGIGYWLSDSFQQGTLGLPSLSIWMRLLGLTCMIATGVASGSGIWGAVKIVRFYMCLRRTCDPAWYPLRPRQIEGYEALSSFALVTALVFSCGALFAPIIVLVLFDSNGLIQLLAATGLLCLMLGSTVLFLIPTKCLADMARKTREAHLELLAEEIEARMMNSPFGEFRESQVSKIREYELNFESLLALREVVVNETTLTRTFRLIWQVSVLAVIPLLVGFLPAVGVSIFP